MSEGTSPSSSYDEGSRSTPSNLPKAATRARKKKTSDSEDEDYVAVEDEPLPRRRCSRKSMAHLLPLSQECRRRHLQEGFPLPTPKRLPLEKP